MDPVQKNAPAEVAKQTDGAEKAPESEPKVPAEKQEPKKPEQKKEPTAGEALGTDKQPEGDGGKKPEPEAPRMVPEAVFLDLKKDLKELQKSIKEGNTAKSEVPQSLKDIADKYDVSPDFLQELTSAVKSVSESEFEKRLEKELAPYKEQSTKAKKAELDKVFNEHFDKTIEAMPEFKDIAQKDVIKALAMDPKNANKTFAEIVESAYGHLVSGKKNIDGAKPGSGKDDNAEIDFERAAKDTEYFQSIMANPLLKEKYNADLQKRNRL